ncbi:hypothetical protein FKV24_010830 [Lysobacter maris]|uniref:Fe2OG dioxygenase domain-containing protein n=1 Tax=Marilutibacter maris TaxID=1605891 RepID=A0A508AS86_9GAMM|nr:hypothetical protein [Lysobacter maris]KAB8184778.1 hypothetical protein FKV24_010830 [Lysobacter maris]
MSTSQTLAAAPSDLLGQCAGHFRDRGFSVLRGVLAPAEAELCANYAVMQTGVPGYYTREDSLGSQGRYADTLGECLLLRLLPLMERVADGPLHPCYSYLRVYMPGAELPRHLDRPSCEISTSLTLGFDAACPWTLGIQSEGEDLELPLGPGDMLAYRGADLPHWRGRFDGRYWVQLFLHYVRADGQFAEYRFDGRERIGPFDPSRQTRRFDAAHATGAGATGEGA